ncbi:MAG: serine hydrolase [Bacteroidota bacterium]
MKKTNTMLFIALFILSATLKAQLPAELQTRLQTVLDSVCLKNNIKGASAAVLYPGKGTWKGTSGISHDNAPINSDMLLGMGSNTKTFISTATLILQEKGLLNIDDSIGKWIHNKPNINGQITIKQCLNHTSGIFEYTKNESVNDSIFGNPGKIWTKDELLALANEPYFAPGTSWKYSNTNYIIVGEIIEKVSGKSHQQVVRELILTPAGLTNTFFYDEANVSSRMPHQWSKRFNGTSLMDMTKLETDYNPTLYSMASTAGSMVTTAEDNVQFWHKLISGQLLSPESFRQLTTLVDDGYGLGIFFYSKALNNRSFYSHGGTYFGFINENMVDTTSGVCISVLTNQDSVTNNTLFSTVIRALHKVSIQMPVGLKESVYNNPSFKIYPNPASNEINIEHAENKDDLKISIYDMTGQLQYETQGTERSIPVNDLKNGIYFIQLVNGKGELIHTQKLIISK